MYCLAGSVWGCARSTLNTTYKMFIQPIMLYGCEPLITATEVSLKPLEKAHNQALRLITGGIKSTPIDAMLLVTGSTTIGSLIKEKALILYEKLLRVPMDKFFRIYENRPRHLKTQSGLIQKAIELKNTLQIDDKPKSLSPPMNPLADIDVVDTLAKKETTILQCMDRPMSFHTMKALIRREFQTSRCDKIKARTKEKQWTVALSNIPDWPRIEAVAEFRLRTGHDCLAKHLHRLGVYTQPTCPLCNLQEEMEKTHLIRCPALKTSTESQRYWEARRLLMNCY
ncbi:unnamed protein product [Rodentolepis nana]|uniref:Zf-RVT domain-containing protein n=1 Tax=Rodentolepis nana TaxID=102285 RepID=A0A0R3TSE0_RODNA|nr:unnamed protein product [Rodentolepis nana]